MATTAKPTKQKLQMNYVTRLKALQFDILDDHHDPKEHQADDLNRYFTTPMIYPVTMKAQAEEEGMVMDVDVDDSSSDKEIEEMDDDMQADDQQQLSQKMDELSVKHPKRPFSESPTDEEKATTTKKKQKTTTMTISEQTNDVDESYNDRIIDHEDQGDQIPKYLLTNYLRFEQQMKKVCERQTSVSIDDLRQIALAKHHRGEWEQRKLLFRVYLRSVRGELKERGSEGSVIDRHYVPKHVRSMAKHDGKEDGDYHFYESVLQQRMEEIETKLAQHQQQLNTLKQQCPQLTSNMEHAVDEIVEHEGMKLIRMRYEAQMALVQCDYDAAMLERRYQAEKPSQSQLETAYRLYSLRFDFEKARRLLMEWKQSMVLHRVPRELHTTMLSLVNSVDQVVVRQKMTEYMTVRIAEAEQNFDRCRQRINMEIEQVWKQHRDQYAHQSMPKPLTDLIELRFVNITDRLRIIYNYRINYPLDTSPKLVGYGPSLSVHAAHALTKKQLQLLNRGPTYVMPCQLFSSTPSPSSSESETMKALYAPLKQQLTRLFAKYQMNIALSMDVHIKVRDMFTQYFSQVIPSDLRQRSQDEKKLVGSIRRILAQPESPLILRRTADNLNTFYLGNRDEFEEKSATFMAKTDLYDFQLFVDEKRYGTEWQSDVHDMIDSMNHMLRQIHGKKGIDSDLLNQLTIDPSTIKLPYLYFLPQIGRDNELSVMPVIVAYQSPTWLLGRFLDRLLRPAVRLVMRNTRFDDEIDFAQKLHQFGRNGQVWTSTTLLATIHISNYYTIASHARMADVLEYFLHDDLPGNTVENITMVHMKNLVQLFLYNNVFVYDDKLYMCVKGSPITMPLTETLANIYLYQWQKMIVKEVKARQQFFGRYEQDIFFTWNGSADELQQLSQRIQARDSNIQFEMRIGSSVHYLNAHVENRSGQLFTRADHSADQQPYTLPYVTHHSIEDHSDWLRFALLRAACYSTLVTDFIRERLYLELSYLANGYSLYFVEQRVDHFFNYFNMTRMRYSSDQTLYERFRSQVFDFVEQHHERLDKLYRYEDDRKLFHFNYLYEYGPRSAFNDAFHRMWTQYFKHHRIFSTEKSKVMLTSKHQHSLNAYLAQSKAYHRTLSAKKP